ncbi:MAG: hypothetical protein PHO13_05520 [Fermentimonas sp.]|jgi:uncharacterized membrane protein|nr:hypothetical protein [Fermentimonas sp.]NLC85642.1 hypothetical protein [Bacteroidales bacterium]HBT84425.1 hypothetical protein [Porphyromonadaceae bacterium]MDD2931705.1 hypothetical protein [Fermentimonas sp.]MDD3188941.1 hypothetical protein [Fermentimonas sp.]
MSKKKTLFKVLWIIIAVLAIASITSLIVFPQWKGIFLAGSGGFLILNILIAMFFINQNYKS